MFRLLFPLALLATLPLSHASTDKDIKNSETAARAVLQKHCYQCHNLNMDKGGLGEVTHLEGLIENGKVSPGAPEKSRIIRRMEQKEHYMPKNAKRVPQEEIALVKAWIRSLDLPEAIRKDTFLPYRDSMLIKMYTHIVEDLKTLPEENRRHYRYFTYYEKLEKGEPEKEIEETLEALGKVLNSTSWGPKIVIPEKVQNPDASLVRIDLRELQRTKKGDGGVFSLTLGWTISKWAKIHKFYPYSIQAKSDTQLKALETQMQLMVGTPFPHMRADWIVANVSHPELYGLVLGMGETHELPKYSDLKKFLGVDENTTRKIAIKHSGVSTYNRVMKRIASDCGAFWETLDHSAFVSGSNVFNDPLTQAEVGGEAIFDLPNGLHGYALYNAQDGFLDIAPVNIVNHPQFENGVENFNACFSCHQTGLIARADELAKHVESSSINDFTNTQKEYVQKYYAPATDWFFVESALLDILEEDNKNYRAALKQVNPSNTGMAQIKKVRAKYGKPLTRESLLKEFNHFTSSTASFYRDFETPDTIRSTLDNLFGKNKTISRKTMENDHDYLVHRLGMTAPSIDNQFYFETSSRNTVISSEEFTWDQAWQKCTEGTNQLPTVSQIKKISELSLDVPYLTRDLFVKGEQVLAKTITLRRTFYFNEPYYEEGTIRVCKDSGHCLNFVADSEPDSFTLYRATVLFPSDYFKFFSKTAQGKGFVTEKTPVEKGKAICVTF